jgi:hypothetical protein
MMSNTSKPEGNGWRYGCDTTQQINADAMVWAICAKCPGGGSCYPQYVGPQSPAPPPPPPVDSYDYNIQL